MTYSFMNVRNFKYAGPWRIQGEGKSGHTAIQFGYRLPHLQLRNNVR